MRLRRRRRATDGRLQPIKLRAIDYACESLGSRSVADLGGAWAVDGGYALYAADTHEASRVVICDDDFTPPLLERAERDPNVELIRGNFGTKEVAKKVGPVDAILMFDIVLHQVDPNWDELIAMYAGQTRSIALAGPWWVGDETIRLPDLPRSEYLEKVPNSEFHETVIDRLDEINPRRGRPWRDCHDIWQWGITDADVRSAMARLSFECVHEENRGPWHGAEHFEDRSYVFTRT
jgi:hypothetical protein